MIGAAVVLTILPVFVYLLVVWLADRYEKEPLPLLGLALLGGTVVAPVLVRIVEKLLGIPNSLFPLLMSQLPLAPPNLAGALVEEAAKSLVIIALAARLPAEFDDIVDGVVYGVTVGAGFALAENLVYLRSLLALESVAQVGASTFFGIFVAGLNHCFFSGIFGASLGFTREAAEGPARRWIPAAGFLAAVLYHMGYLGLGHVAARYGGAVAAVAAAADWAGLFALIFVLRWGWDRTRAVMAETLREEQAAGAVTAEELAALLAGPLKAEVAALRSGGWSRLRLMRRLHQAQAELAFARWRERRGRGARGLGAQHYRAEIQRLRALLAAGGRNS
ncbi:MAG: PrsW family intramembrane metalloprotease [Armatimonadetes bacterium]|nr:PrsW family intramembrane metalloprotease [Armatimonadota bacterium]